MKSYEKVQKWLDENNLSQRELADQVGMTEVAMSRFLRGTLLPHAPYIVNIAKVMGIENPWDLIRDDYIENKEAAKEKVKEPDKIALKDAVDVPVWKMIWAAEPGRMVNVLMTYSDLKVICDLIDKKQKNEKENKEWD